MQRVDNKFRQRTRPIRSKLRRGAWSIAGRSAQHLLWRLAHRAPHAEIGKPIPRTFFGVNCSPNPDPAWDAVFLGWIEELGVGSVRVDVTYESHTEAFWRWVEALHGAGLEVVVHLVQPAAAAAHMHTQRERENWAQFTEAILEPVRGMLAAVEIGSTPNRHTWSGYTVADQVTAHEIARPILDGYGLRCAGPNVSDFAPYFNAAVLGALRARGLTPHIHTDNLFVDRPGLPPERPDHRAVGRVLSPLARLTLPRKIRHLAALSEWAGCEETWVTCTAWTVRTGDHTKPRYVSPETQAAYLMRFYLHAAASGLVQRVFWGQLAHHLRGLIDNGHRVRHDPPEVFLWPFNPTLPNDTDKRPAFSALKALTACLAGRAISANETVRGKVRMALDDGSEIAWAVDDSEAPDLT